MLNIPVPAEPAVDENDRAESSWYNYWLDLGRGMRSLGDQVDSNTAVLAANGRNVLHNGDFRIVQRGTPGAYVSCPPGTTFVADRWRVSPAGAAVDCVAAHPTNFLRGAYICGFSIPGPGCTGIYLSQRIEARNMLGLVGSPAVTFSAFFALAANPGSFTPHFYIQTPNAVDNWSAYATQIDVDLQPVGAAAAGNQRVSWSGDLRGITNILNGMEIYLFMPSTAVVNGAFFWISECQLEPVAYVGAPPTPFELPDHATELMKCKRYFQRWLDPPLRGAVITATSAGRMGMPLGVEMRTSPTATFGGTLYIFDGTVTPTVSAFGGAYCQPTSIEFDMTTSGGMTAGRPAVMFNSAGGNIDLNAEL